jgi:hypothetical protein
LHHRRQGRRLPDAVIVAGHAVLRRWKNLTADDSWCLLDYQRGEPPRYIEHVRAGIEAAAANPNAVLVISGGPTRAEAGPLTEAYSYYMAAVHYAWFGHPAVARRTIIEDFARDSFENLLFGLCRFKEFTGEYPATVTIVSWGFKEQRFRFHRECIRFPEERFRYLAPNNPEALEQALRAEKASLDGYRADPYSSSPHFRAKRAERNHCRRQNGYAISCPEAAPLLTWAGPELYSGPVPW